MKQNSDPTEYQQMELLKEIAKNGSNNDLLGAWAQFAGITPSPSLLLSGCVIGIDFDRPAFVQHILEHAALGTHNNHFLQHISLLLLSSWKPSFVAIIVSSDVLKAACSQSSILNNITDMIDCADKNVLALVSLLEPLASEKTAIQTMAAAVAMEIDRDDWSDEVGTKMEKVIDLLINRRGMETFDEKLDVASREYETRDAISTSYFGRQRSAWQTQQTLEDHLSDHQSTHQRGRKL